MPIHLNRREIFRLPLLVFLVAAISFTVAFSVHAASIFDIEFPIAELGNCADKAECKAFCAVEDHEEVCSDFAAKYGIGGARERVDKEKIIQKDGGPGNCALGSSDPEKSCHSYCAVQSHMRECVSYAKEHNLMKGKELEEAEKVIKALDGGATLPAGCTNEESCRNTCESPKNIAVARECFAFAEKAGLLPPGVDLERAEKLFKLIEDGKSPFKSPKDFEQCENPVSQEILEQCVSFASENGFIAPEEADMIRKTGGKGPGGCRGRNECEAFCSENQDECSRFAEEHDLIRPEDKARMKEGTARIKESVQSAPPEVKDCLNSTVGEEKLQKIFSGQTAPNRELGEKMRSCFEQAFQNRKDQQHEDNRDRDGVQGRENEQGNEEGYNGEFAPPEGEFRDMRPREGAEFDERFEKMRQFQGNSNEERRLPSERGENMMQRENSMPSNSQNMFRPQNRRMPDYRNMPPRANNQNQENDRTVPYNFEDHPAQDGDRGYEQQSGGTMNGTINGEYGQERPMPTPPAVEYQGSDNTFSPPPSSSPAPSPAPSMPPPSESGGETQSAPPPPPPSEPPPTSSISPSIFGNQTANIFSVFLNLLNR